MAKTKLKPSDEIQETPEQILKQTRDHGLVSDLWNFLKTSAKWWIVPILLVVAVLGIILILAQTGMAPLIYVLF